MQIKNQTVYIKQVDIFIKQVQYYKTMNLINLEQFPNVQIGLLSEIDPAHQQKATVSTLPIPFTYLHYVEKIANKLGLKFDRTIFCKHRGSCVCSCFASSTKAGVLSYLIKVGISIIFSIRKIIKQPKQIFAAFANKDSLKFGLFICSFLIILRSLICGLRRKLDYVYHKYAFLIGGLIGATASAFILDKNTRQTFGLFLLARALDITYRSLVEKKIIPQIKWFYPIVYGLMMLVTGGLALGHQPAAMSPDLKKFYLLFTSQTPSDQQMRRIWIERKNIELLKKGVPTYNALDYLPKAKEIYQREVLKKI